MNPPTRRNRTNKSVKASFTFPFFFIIFICSICIALYTRRLTQEISLHNDAIVWEPRNLSSASLAHDEEEQQEEHDQNKLEKKEMMAVITTPSTTLDENIFNNFFIHVPKTGGRAYQLAMRKIANEHSLYHPKKASHTKKENGATKWTICNYGPTPLHQIKKINYYQDLACLGHMAEIHYNDQVMNKNSGVYTMVRSPQKHVVSQYYHCKEATGRPSWKVELMPPSLDEWLEEWINVMSLYYNSDNNATSIAQNREKMEEKMKQKFQCYTPIDLQSRFLGLKTKTLSKEEYMKDLTSRYNVIGLTEEFDKSICLIAISMTNGFIPKKCDCTTTAAQQTIKKDDEQTQRRRHENGIMDHGVTHHGSTFNATLKQKNYIDQLTKVDQLLYEYSKELFHEQVKRFEREYSFQMC